MFKTKKHPLPNFPEGVKEQFYSLCEALSQDDLEVLRAELNRYFAESLKRKLVKYDKEAQKALYDRALMLMDCYHEKTPKQQKIIVGAIRYFAIAEDIVSEEYFSTGLNDDIKVMNHVLEELGFSDYAIPLSS